MGALQNPKYEKFAGELSELKKPVDAFVLAGYAPHKGNATRLAKRPEIRERVRELLEEAAEYADIRRVRILVELDRVGRANLRDFFEPIDPAKPSDGYRLRNLLELPRHVSAALAGIEWDDAGKPKIKLHPKNEANITLLKHLGGLPEPERADVNIFNVLAVEDQRVLADYLEALAGGAEAARFPAPGERGAPGEVP